MPRRIGVSPNASACRPHRSCSCRIYPQLDAGAQAWQPPNWCATPSPRIRRIISRDPVRRNQGRLNGAVAGNFAGDQVTVVTRPGDNSCSANKAPVVPKLCRRPARRTDPAVAAALQQRQRQWNNSAHVFADTRFTAPAAPTTERNKTMPPTSPSAVSASWDAISPSTCSTMDSG